MNESGLSGEDLGFSENELITLPENYHTEAPLNLIEFQGNKFVLNDKALNFIKSIEEEIIVVSIVGKARTGKSYLMNLLLNTTNNKGFDVGSTINSCTRGIWIWGNTRNKQGSNTKILFLDSEGTSSVDLSTKTYDSKIFALVVLISSLFVYNTTANIDEKSISELSLAAHLSSSIAVNSAVNKDSILTELAPKFIWVLRDFTLEKVNPETGEEMSSNEYLELCLRNKISGRNSAENNFIRENILKYFHRRECITLPRPVESEEDLRSLNKLPFANLKANFRSEFLQLRNKIYNESNAKKINGMKLTGRTLANFLTEFVNSINSGVVPNITNAWDSVISTDIESNYDKAVKFYKENVKSPEGNIFSFLYDVRHKSVLIYEKVLAFNIEIMTNRSYNDIYQNYRSKLFNVISAHEKKILQDDKDKWNRISLDTIRLGNKNIQSKLFNNKYSSEDGFSKLREDLLDMMQNYENKTKESSHSDDKLKILVKVLNDQTRESLYYMVTNINEKTNEQMNQIEILQVKEVQLSEDLVNYDNKKLMEINKALELKIKHLEVDKGNKTDAIATLKQKLFKLEKQLDSSNQIKLQRNKRPKEDWNDLRFNSTVMTSSARDCDCKCLLF